MDAACLGDIQLVEYTIIQARVVRLRSNVTELVVEEMHGGLWQCTQTLDDWRLFLKSLKAAFPYSKSLLPRFPIKTAPLSKPRLFGSKESWAVRLVDAMNVYLHKLLALPPFISRTLLVSRFLAPHGPPVACETFHRSLVRVACHPLNTVVAILFTPATTLGAFFNRITAHTNNSNVSLFHIDHETGERIQIMDTDDLRGAILLMGANAIFIAE